MPTYLYETIQTAPTDLVERFEVRQPFTEPPLSAHPTTGVPVKRVISGGMGYFAASDGTSMPDAGGCGPQNCGCGKFS